MEPSPPVAEAPRRKLSRRKWIAILLAVAIPIAVFATWQILRPRSIGEVLAMDHLRVGSDISVQGTITAIGREDTSYGPRVYLQLDHNVFCGATGSWNGNLLGDPNASYAVGATYQTTIHPQSVSIDGDPAVWAPELACPFPALRRDIGVVIDAVSQVRDLPLAYNGTDVAGWSHYEIRTQNATGYSPDLLPVDLLKSLPLSGAANPIDSANEWQELEAVFYVKVSAALSAEAPGFSIADRMTSLAAPTSDNRTLRFVDVNANGRVDWGDRVDVLMPPTGSPNRWQTYLLRIGDWSGGGSLYGAAVHVILVGPAGPLEPLAAGASTAILGPRSAGRPAD